jgi:hypothetical protein
MVTLVTEKISASDSLRKFFDFAPKVFFAEN